MHRKTMVPYVSRRLLFVVIAAIWLGVVGLSLLWNFTHDREVAFRYAEAEASSSYNKDLVYRRWASLQGGVYAPPTAQLPPNPYLDHLPDRDLLTTTGKALTLVNPAYMTRQVHEVERAQYGVRGHITSLRPLNPQNAADPWETEVLKRFEEGLAQKASLEPLDGEPHLRFMKPMLVEASCLKCHAQQGYRLGEIRGGISVSVPFAPYAAVWQEQRRQHLLSHLVIAALGLFGLWTANGLLRSREAALAASEARHRSILATAMDGVLLADRQGQIVEANQRYCLMSGYTATELQGMPISRLEAQASPAEVASRLEAVISLGEDRYETRHRRQDGSVFDVAIGMQYNTALGGQFVAFLHDIAARKEAEAEQRRLQLQLQQAQKMEAIGTLAGGIAHDFNNILGVIIGYAEIVHDDLPPSPLREEVGQIVVAADRAKDLVRQILTFSRQAEFHKSTLWPAYIVKECLKFLRSSLPATITIEQHIDKAAGPIFADATQIHQLFMNLCTNAFHAMEECGGTLRVSLDLRRFDAADEGAGGDLPLTGEYVQLTVADTGTGMVEEVRQRIFEPYFTTKGVGKGTGMGLAIVHGVVEDHGGYITCHSQPGVGTVFAVFLPKSDEEAAQATAEPADIAMGNERVLLVADEEMLVGAGKLLLERLGYRVTPCVGSQAAWETFARRPDDFDVVISDQTMPGMTGVELVQRIRGVRPRLPIVLASGYSSQLSREKAAAVGVQGFVLKPFTREALGRVLREVLDDDRDGAAAPR